MATAPRFERPANQTRPEKAHRYDTFGPKIGRPLTLFGQSPLLAWTSLEADSEVNTYCERPLVIPDTKRTVDFWVRKNATEYFIILLRQSERGEDGETNVPKKVRTWLDACSTPVLLTNPEQYAQQKVFLDNWGSIIRDLSAFSRYVPRALVEEVREAVQENISLTRLEQEFEDRDPAFVRVAVFSLLHQGRLVCPELRQFELSSSMMFAPA